MKLILALIVGLFIGYYAHELRDKKEVTTPEPSELPATVSFEESKILQADYVDHSPDSAMVYLNLSQENLQFIHSVNEALKYPKALGLYLARQNGENNSILLVPMSYSAEEGSDGDTSEGESEEAPVFILDQRNPICPPICDKYSPYKSRD